VDVPGYTGVRIHPGNTKADTLGCILVGQSRGTDSIGASRAAFGVLMPKLEAAAAREKLMIDIVEERAEMAPTTRGRKAVATPVAARKRAPAAKVAKTAKSAEPAAKSATKPAAEPAIKPAAKSTVRGRTRGS